MYNIKKIIVILGFIFLSTNAAQARDWQDVVVLSVNGESVSLNSEVGGQLWSFLDKTTQQKTQRYASRCIDEKSISCDKSLLDKEIAKINRQANVVTQMLRVDLTDTSVPYILLIQNYSESDQQIQYNALINCGHVHMRSSASEFNEAFCPEIKKNRQLIREIFEYSKSTTGNYEIASTYLSDLDKYFSEKENAKSVNQASANEQRIDKLIDVSIQKFLAVSSNPKDLKTHIPNLSREELNTLRVSASSCLGSDFDLCEPLDKALRKLLIASFENSQTLAVAQKFDQRIKNYQIRNVVSGDPLFNFVGDENFCQQFLNQLEVTVRNQAFNDNIWEIGTEIVQSLFEDLIELSSNSEEVRSTSNHRFKLSDDYSSNIQEFCKGYEVNSLIQNLGNVLYIHQRGNDIYGNYPDDFYHHTYIHVTETTPKERDLLSVVNNLSVQIGFPYKVREMVVPFKGKNKDRIISCEVSYHTPTFTNTIVHTIPPQISGQGEARVEITNIIKSKLFLVRFIDTSINVDMRFATEMGGTLFKEKRPLLIDRVITIIERGRDKFNGQFDPEKMFNPVSDSFGIPFQYQWFPVDSFKDAIEQSCQDSEAKARNALLK